MSVKPDGGGAARAYAMSFAAPLVLLGLLAIPVLVAWYTAEQRDRRRAAAARSQRPAWPRR